MHDPRPTNKTALKQNPTNWLSEIQAKEFGPTDYLQMNSKMKKWYYDEMKHLNNLYATVKDHQQMMDQQEVGAVLYVNKIPGKEPYFTIGTVPTVTLVDDDDEAHLGAPILEEAFKETVSKHYSAKPSVPACIILAAIGENTLELDQFTTEDIIEKGQSIVFPSGNNFGINEGTDKLFKVLFLLTLCSAPVGIFWPTKDLIAKTSLATIQDCEWSYSKF